jgi:hypothetical protein
MTLECNVIIRIAIAPSVFKYAEMKRLTSFWFSAEQKQDHLENIVWFLFELIGNTVFYEIAVYAEIVAHAEIIAHGILFLVLDKDKFTPESMFNGYDMQINVSNEGNDIVPTFIALKNR